MVKVKFNWPSEESLRFTSEAYKIYTERIKECEDGKNHKNPNIEENRCMHCYNRLKYKTTQVKEILESRKNLPSHQQPMDAPILRDIERNEINLMKFKDSFYAVRAIGEELKKEKGLVGKI